MSNSFEETQRNVALSSIDPPFEFREGSSPRIEVMRFTTKEILINYEYLKDASNDEKRLFLKRVEEHLGLDG